MSNPNEEAGNTVLMFVSVVIGITLLLVMFLVPWPEQLSDWGRGKAPVETFALVLTPLGAFAAVGGLIFNFYTTGKGAAAAQAALANGQFLKGVELLGSGSEASRVGGIAVLTNAALADKGGYTVLSAVTILSAHVSDMNLSKVEELRHNYAKAVPLRDLPPTDHSTFEALRRLGELMEALNVTATDQCTVNNAYVGRANISGHDFRDMHFRRAMFIGATFDNGTFANLKIQGGVGKFLHFNNCRFNGRVELDLEAIDADEALSEMIVFDPGCSGLEHVTVGGQPAAAFAR